MDKVMYQNPENMPVANEALPYASFFSRLVAYLIDAIFIGLILSIIDPYVIDSIVNGISFFGAWLYFALMESSKKQATLGKIVMKLKVADLENRPLSFLHATGRHFSKILSVLSIGIGFLMVLFTKKRQGLHDIVAGTLVLKK